MSWPAEGLKESSMLLRQLSAQISGEGCLLYAPT